MTRSWFDVLDAGTEGKLLTGPAVEPALRLYTSALPGRPAAVLQAATTEDVTAAVRVAASEGLPLSIRGGGHSGAGFGVVADGLMLDLGGWRDVRVEPGRRIARARPGATWGDYDRATQEHGLASTGGIVSTTGVAGLTLGGGIGALRGLHGLAVDNLRGAEVVLADGSQVRADAESEPELFWALRGGGGNFGVVVDFEFDVHPVREMVTGLLSWPLALADEITAAYLGVADELPDEAVAEMIFGHDAAGEPAMSLTPRVIGGAEVAAPLLGVMRAVGSPADGVAVRSYTDGQRFMDAIATWGSRHYWHTTTLRGLDEAVVGILTEHALAAPSRSSAIIVEHLHGEISRRDPAGTAVGFRHAPYNVFVEAKWSDAADDRANRDWARSVISALESHSAGGAYVNYLPRDATPEQVRSAYGPDRHDRLQAVKAGYDPTNLFRRNQNVVPGVVPD